VKTCSISTTKVISTMPRKLWKSSRCRV